MTVAARAKTSDAPSGVHRQGFTLIEIVVTLAVLAILVAIALPRIDLDAYRVNAMVRGVTAKLAYAQRLAVTLQHDVRVAIDQPNSRFRIHEDANNNGVIDAGERVTYLPLEEGVTFGRGAAPAVTYSNGATGPATVNFVGTQDGMPVVVFRRDGSASENGGFYLNTTRALLNGDSRHVRAGEIVRSSGRVLWYSYGSGSWRQGQ